MRSRSLFFLPLLILGLAATAGLNACSDDPSGPTQMRECEATIPCAMGQRCVAGSCLACEVSCQANAQECFGSEGLRVCQAGPDGCPVWSDTMPCPNGTLCNTGTNTCECTGECEPGEREMMTCQAASVGECEPGERTRSCLNNCRWGRWSKCNGRRGVSDEKCDGKDNNCNGQADEALTRPCTSGCGEGTQTCNNGEWSDCQGSGIPSKDEETVADCNNIDDDCDGQTDNVKGSDERLTRECDIGCGNGQQTCFEGRWGDCEPTGEPVECNIPGAREVTPVEGGMGQGVCAGSNVRVCGDDCSWGPTTMEPGIEASAEMCNGLDDDCDGVNENIAISDGMADGFLFDTYEGDAENGFNDTCGGCFDLGTDPEAVDLVSSLIHVSHYDPNDWFCFRASDSNNNDTERVVTSLENLSPGARLELTLLRERESGSGCDDLEEVATTAADSMARGAVEWFETEDDDSRRYYLRIAHLEGEGCYQLKVHGLR